MPTLNIEPIVFTVRSFAEGKEWGDDYKLVLTVQKFGSVGHISGCHGDFTHAEYRHLAKRLKQEFGIEKLKWSR